MKNIFGEEIPVVKVFITDSGEQYFFWCPFCQRLHYHGSAGLGHRLPHCINQNSAFLGNDGYVLEKYTKKELREIGLPTNYYDRYKKSRNYKIERKLLLSKNEQKRFS